MSEHETTPTEQIVTVLSCKYDGRINRQWKARLVEQTGALIVLEGVFAEEIRHPLLGTIMPGTSSTEYYWTNRWYSVFRFREPSGKLRNYYGNINQPVEFAGRTLRLIDLDIDVLVAPDFSYRVVDEDEFETHAAQFNYPHGVRAQVEASLTELITLLEAREFPFHEER